MKKITRTTIKSFIKKNFDDLYISTRTRFNGMIDCVDACADQSFHKVERDERMEAIDLNFPAYGFKNHKGYGTKEHLDAIKIYGPCVQHRKSFKPIKNFKFSALEAFDIYEMIIEARKLLENKNDQEIKKELSRLLEEAEFLNEEKKG